MYFVCKIKGRSSFRQTHKKSLWCKNHYLRREKVHFEFIKELDRVLMRILKHYTDLFYPLIELAFLCFVAFVLPVCRISAFGDLIHPFASYLYFNPLTFRAHYSNM